MENKILNWTLKIIIHTSALVSVWKPKNKILHTIFECIYCVVISVLPIFFVSFLVMVIRGDESIDIVRVMGWILYIVVGILIYFIVLNRDSEKKIEDCLLLGALYVDEYIHNKMQIRKNKFTLLAEIMQFLLLFIALLWGITSLMIELKILSVDIFMIGLIINLFLVYMLFVYGKCEEGTRKRRKAILGVFISLIWLIIVCIRINHYWMDMTQVGLEDMLILFFSAVFTIPTIYEWMKNIPAKLVEPHSTRVYERRDKILNNHTSAKNECKKLGIEFLNNMKEGIKIIIFKWKNGEKRKIIKFLFYIFAMIGIMVLAIWLANNLTLLMDMLIECIKLWYSNLNYGIQEIVNDIFVLLFLIGIMLWLFFMAPRIYVSKKNKLEKIEYVVCLIIVELVFGAAVIMLLFNM